MTVQALHLVALAAWFGVVAVESVIELLPLRRPELAAAAATFHFWIDLLVELPLLLGVLVTGGLLLRGQTLDTELGIKVAAGGAAIVMNLCCVAFVIARHRGGAELRSRRTRLVFATATVGMPLGLVALWIGLGRM